MQREDVLGEALKLLELQGIANTTLEMVAERVDYPLDELRRFWPDKEAILYDALRYLSQQIDVWRRQLMLDETQTAEQKLLARYQALVSVVCWAWYALRNARWLRENPDKHPMMWATAQALVTLPVEVSEEETID